MTYKHLNTQELTFIYHFWKQGTKAYLVARALRRSAETIYRVYRFLNQGKTIVQYQEHYHHQKTKCGRKSITLPKDERKYIQKQVSTLAGHQIPSLVVTSIILAVVCEPYIGCSSVASLMSVNCQ